MKKKIIVIGAGFGGLSVAALLAKEGNEVTIIEKNQDIGGRARVWKTEGFVFDMGPSWYLMPEVFERFFSNFGRKPEEFFELRRLDPSYRMFFGDDKIVDISKDMEKNLETFEKIEKGGAEKLRKYLSVSEYEYEVSMRDFVYKDYKSPFDFFNFELLSKGAKLHVFESMDRYTKRFFSSSLSRKILEYTIVFLGGTPKSTPALYSLMSHVDFNLGVWYPIGGINKVVEALERLCKSHNVKIITNKEVEKIIVENGIARGVVVGNETINADIIVSNADYAHMETKLLEEKYRSYKKEYFEKAKIAPSGFVIFLGLKKKLPKLVHHNLFLENDWNKHFETIFEKPSWPDAPSYYISCPSKTDPSIAPDGFENIFILVPVASGLEDAEETIEKYYKKIIKHFEKVVGEKIEDQIVVKRIFTHTDFIKDYNAYKGTALGLSHTLWQSAIFRPSNKSKKVENLYYTGQYTHPGIGVPMTLICSEIVAKKISDENAE